MYIIMTVSIKRVKTLKRLRTTLRDISVLTVKEMDEDHLIRKYIIHGLIYSELFLYKKHMNLD